ncbi:MAG TPA: efflux RND transporter periplasmic adaptor subunit [Puia sp.]|uniref:efflux RND transporter periplasmic adaptor subunit n=1 Tax=Puia sp. TaxID=2045100 RepID=UPI002BDCFB14|nr:efflux RND transporter periplasmic adaptor subunit [Puia sp.]HVU93658.1 efflux RND transporter periplasmic adaptor subunit [Puia sp.]
MKNNHFHLLILGLCSVIAGCNGGAGAAATRGTGLSPQAAPIETLVLQKGALPQQVKLPAQLASFEEVSIFPKVNGYVKDVYVDVGSAVKKGQLLMTLEAPELLQAATQARERFARAKLDYTISAENYRRMALAAETPGAVSPMNLASLKAKADADSTLCNAEKANWQMQEAILGYLRVTAPFDGVIAERNVHPGALVSAETHTARPMLDLRQVDHLRLQVDIPESIAAGLQSRDTIVFYLSAYPGRKFIGHISRKSQLVNAQFRAERMELDVYNTDGKLAPGMYADVLFDSKGDPDAYAVPRTAVVTSTERKYVIAVRGGRSERIDVATGNESADRVEITGKLQPGERIVSKASDDLQDGVTIK